MNRSQTGAVLGSTTTTGTCVSMGVDNPYAIAGCAVIGAFAGAEIMYKSDYDVHNAVFVDHLNNGPNGSSYTNWFNSKTGNSGIIKTTRTWYKGPFKCRDYESTIDIAPSWPMQWASSGPVRRTNFGVACMLPDGRIEIQK